RAAAPPAARGEAPGPRAAVLSGPLGIGKTVLVEEAVAWARAGGTRVLRAEGSASEAGLAFASLHQLLRPVLGEVRALPARQRGALALALGLPQEEAPESADPLLTGTALLTLLSGLAAGRPLLLVLDDAQWCDRASLDALAFAVRRLAPAPESEPEPVGLVLATRAPAALPSFGRTTAHLPLAPLA
ncbi:ATP-binding protein, partial [Streptomyces sp. SID11385]|uniref:AAA family ATPase n=1 Tax=Streptomyces sp. SID11385 TaxID=2706031 RepID=UPI0013C7D88E